MRVGIPMRVQAVCWVLSGLLPMELHGLNLCQSPNAPLATEGHSSSDEPPVWNIHEIFGYNGAQDPKLAQDMSHTLNRAQAFRTKFQGQLRSKHLSARRLLEAIQTYETILDSLDRVHDYLYGLMATHLGNAPIEAVNTRVRQQIDEINALTSFFDLELAQLDGVHLQKLLATGKLDGYRHFITVVRQQAPYLKPRSEEELLRRVDSVFGGMFRVYQKIIAQLRFRFQGPQDPEPKDYLFQDMTPFISDHPDPEVRRRAQAVVFEVFHHHRGIFASLFSEFVVASQLKDERIRGYAATDMPRHLDNEWTQTDAQHLIQTTALHYELAQRLWRAKQRALGLTQLTTADMGAPLLNPSETPPKVTFAQGREKVLRTFRRFAPQLADILERECFGKGCIDARVYPGKRRGGFMANSSPGVLPIILTNWKNSESDSDVLVHESGHWIDSYLGGRGNSRLNTGAGVLRAETASTFAELLMAQDMLATLENPRDRLRALFRFMDGMTTAIFRENVFVVFEYKVHEFVRAHGAIGPDDLERLWVEAYHPYYGEVVQPLDKFPATWAIIHHFYYRFYVYAYTAGSLLGIRMFLKLRQDPSYIHKIIEAYSVGRSRPMKSIYKDVLGIDLDDPQVWDPSFAYYESRLQEIESLVDSVTP